MGEHTGKTLGADLHRLLLIARDKIPAVVDYYADSSRRVAATGDVDSTAFGDYRDRLGTAWMNLRDEYLSVLGITADNLSDTAVALERVVEYYARTDEEAAAELRRLVAESVSSGLDIGSPARLPQPEIPEDRA